MRRTILAILTTFSLLLNPCLAPAAEPLPAKTDSPPREMVLDPAKITRGLREALAIAADRAVRSVAKTDGYMGNPAIRIGLTGEMEQIFAYLGKMGNDDQIDAFILSMNRAAEMAAPKAAPLFADAVRETEFADPGKVLSGGDTAATDYFRRLSADRLVKAYRPAIAASIKETGVDRACRVLVENYNYETSPQIRTPKYEFDDHITEKALDGLFALMGAEEKKIRNEPAARTSDILRKVFGTAQ